MSSDGPTSSDTGPRLNGEVNGQEPRPSAPPKATPPIPAKPNSVAAQLKSPLVRSNSAHLPTIPPPNAPKNPSSTQNGSSFPIPNDPTAITETPSYSPQSTSLMDFVPPRTEPVSYPKPIKRPSRPLSLTRPLPSPPVAPENQPSSSTTPDVNSVPPPTTAAPSPPTASATNPSDLPKSAPKIPPKSLNAMNSPSVSKKGPPPTAPPRTPAKTAPSSASTGSSNSTPSTAPTTFPPAVPAPTSGASTPNPSSTNSSQAAPPSGPSMAKSPSVGPKKNSFPTPPKTPPYAGPPKDLPQVPNKPPITNRPLPSTTAPTSAPPTNTTTKANPSNAPPGNPAVNNPANQPPNHAAPLKSPPMPVAVHPPLSLPNSHPITAAPIQQPAVPVTVEDTLSQQRAAVDPPNAQAHLVEDQTETTNAPVLKGAMDDAATEKPKTGNEHIEPLAIVMPNPAVAENDEEIPPQSPPPIPPLSLFGSIQQQSQRQQHTEPHPPLAVEPISLNTSSFSLSSSPSSTGGSWPTNPLSPRAAAAQEAFTSGRVNATGPKRAGFLALGSRSAALNRDNVSTSPTSSVASPGDSQFAPVSFSSTNAAASQSSPAAVSPEISAPLGMSESSVDSAGAVAAAPSSTQSSSPILDDKDSPFGASHIVGTISSDTVGVTTNGDDSQPLETHQHHSNVLQTSDINSRSSSDSALFGQLHNPLSSSATSIPSSDGAVESSATTLGEIAEDEEPPPPPEGFDEPYEGEATADNMSSGTQYMNIMDNSAITGSTVLGQEDSAQGPPPPGLEPLPAHYHPSNPPPQLLPGVSHLDFNQQTVLSTDAAQADDKKKKKGGFGFFGSSKDKIKDKETPEGEKSGVGGLMSGFKKMMNMTGLSKSGKDSPDSTSSISNSTISNSGNLSFNPAPTPAPLTGEPSPLMNKLDLYSRLMELLCRPDLYLLNISSVIVKRGDVDKQSRAWVHLLTPKGKMVDLLAKVIYTEVEKTDHEGTLFRNNTFSVGLMSAFAHEIGRSYLGKVLGPMLQTVLTAGTDFEINPKSENGQMLDEDTIDKNTIELLEICGKYVAEIIASLPDIPIDIRKVCYHLRNSVQAKFPSSVNTCVGGFFFLRFLTPAVVSPEGFGVQKEDDPISIEARRPLILISKTLQQISNEKYFNEDHMMSLNSFITENIPTFQQFFQDICNCNPDDAAPTGFTPYSYESNKNRDESLIRLHTFLAKSLPEIKSIAQTEPLPFGITYDPINELEKVLTDLGEPPDPKILKAPAVVQPVVDPKAAKKKK